MIRAILSLAVLFSVGCSSVSKETYTEQRTLTYPKKSSSQIKEMYLGGANSRRDQSVVQNNNDINYITNPDLPIETIERENRELVTRAQNRMLREF